MSDISTVYDLLDAAAKRYPIKNLIDKVDPDKSESTLRGELNRQPGHKLALSTSIKIIQITKDYSPLDVIEEMMGRVAYTIPKPEPGDTVKNIAALMAALARECSDNLIALSNAVEDGRIDKREAQKCLKEINDMIKLSVKAKAYLGAFL
jgi:hypothetical protein